MNITSLLIIAALVCPVTKRVMHEGAAPWSMSDDKLLAQASDGCVRNFGEKKPCVKEYHKFKSGHVHIVCGKKVEE
jgi:hypothetical protein